jgi:hypothetical protein
MRRKGGEKAKSRRGLESPMGAPLKPRCCVTCGADISYQHGHSVRCEPCASAHEQGTQRAWRIANHEKIRADAQARYRTNRAKILKPCCITCGADISHQHGNSVRCEPCAWAHKQGKRRAWRTANHEKVRASAQARNRANRQRIRAYSLAWRMANREKVKAYAQAWYRANREKAIARSLARYYAKINVSDIDGRIA